MQHIPHPPQKNSGSALISALFIMTLIAITATAIIQSLQINIARTTRFIRTDQLYLAAQGVSFWAMTQLQDAETPPPTAYPAKFASLYPGIQLSGRLHDLQALFNINNLTNQSYKDFFTILVQEAAPNPNKNLPKMIVAATQNWISPETGVNQDKWNPYYASMKPPYQAAHQLMQSVSEFQFIAGVSPALYQALHSMLTTLPEVTPININTAPAKLLQVLLPHLSPSELDDFILSRKTHPILTQEHFNEIAKKLSLPPDIMTFKSNYFLSVATATQGQHTLTLFTVLKRAQAANKTSQVVVIRESINKL